ncbi:MAG: hypothetical protein IT416_03035 [Candidatus Pacebacteria bacterium]|nr:hypothetical protein [Candidatus Paceibacterota bacterium]
MAKRKGGLLALVTGVAVGAAAMFFSKKENREKTVRVAKKAAGKAMVAKKKAVASAKKAVKKGTMVAKKAVKKAKKK